jgi:hypothetical protein
LTKPKLTKPKLTKPKLTKPKLTKPKLTKRRSLSQVLCLPTALVLPIVRMETSARSRFYRQLSDKRRLSLVKHMAIRILSTIGVALDWTFTLQRYVAAFSFLATKGT